MLLVPRACAVEIQLYRGPLYKEILERPNLEVLHCTGPLPENNSKLQNLRKLVMKRQTQRRLLFFYCG